MAEIFEAKTSEDIKSARDLFEQYARSLDFDLRFLDFAAELRNLPGDYFAAWLHPACETGPEDRWLPCLAQMG